MYHHFLEAERLAENWSWDGGHGPRRVEFVLLEVYDVAKEMYHQRHCAITAPSLLCSLLDDPPLP